jgi:uncharacterized protein (DUF2147 family)
LVRDERMTDEENEVFRNVTIHLIAAISAYEAFAKGDALKKKRLDDWKKSVVAAKKCIKPKATKIQLLGS